MLLKKSLENVIYDRTEMLSNQNKLLSSQNATLNTKLDELTAFKRAIVKKQEEKDKQREKRRNAKKQPQLEAITDEHYKAIINYLQISTQYTPLIKARYAVLTLLLVLTGCRFSEILTIKVDVVCYLYNFNYFPIDRAKGGEKQKKAHITTAGKKLINERSDDIDFLLLNLNINPNDLKLATIAKNEYNLRFLFPGQKKNTHLSRSTFLLAYNKMLQNVPLFKEQNLTIKSHSFRKGYITKLWKQTKDLEFVRQVIGHSSIVSTMGYVKDLTPLEIQQKLEKLDNQTDDI